MTKTGFHWNLNLILQKGEMDFKGYFSQILFFPVLRVPSLPVQAFEEFVKRLNRLAVTTIDVATFSRNEVDKSVF